MFLPLHLRFMIARANTMKPKIRRHIIKVSWHIFPATMSLSRPAEGSPRILNLACDSSIFSENPGHKKFDYDRIKLFTFLKLAQWYLEWCEPACPHFFFHAMIWVSPILIMLSCWKGYGLKWVVSPFIWRVVIHRARTLFLAGRKAVILAKHCCSSVRPREGAARNVFSCKKVSHACMRGALWFSTNPRR